MVSGAQYPTQKVRFIENSWNRINNDLHIAGEQKVGTENRANLWVL